MADTENFTRNFTKADTERDAVDVCGMCDNIRGVETFGRADC